MVGYMENKNIWMIEDFIKNIYIERGIDNLNFGTIVSQLKINIEDIAYVCSLLEKKGKISYQYDVRDNQKKLLHKDKSLRDAIFKAKELLGERNNFLDNVYISIKLTKEYKSFLDTIKK